MVNVANGWVWVNAGAKSVILNLPEHIPYAIDRYINETKRLYTVLK